MAEGGGEVSILGAARDEGGPRDDSATGSESEKELGRVEEVELGVHVDEVGGEEGREQGGQSLDDDGMGGSANEGGASCDGGFENGSE